MFGRTVAQPYPAMQIINVERLEAMTALLAQSDETDALRRHHKVTEGRPDRFTMLPGLAAAYVQSRLLALREREEFWSEGG